MMDFIFHLRASALIVALTWCVQVAVAGDTVANIPQKISRAERRELDSTFKWFLANPPKADGSNFNDRWIHTELLDRCQLDLTAAGWNTYRGAWKNNPKLADKMEASYPILYYLRKATQNAFKEIKKTRVTQGFVLWHIYNMGYVIKTKDACFAIDLVARDSEKLAGILDFAICSHIHTDHFDAPFLDAMTAAHKPVFSPFYEKGTVVRSTGEYHFGDVTIRLTTSCQQPNVPVLISQINLGADANNYTLYDIADARPLEDLNPDRPVNLFILHIQNGLNIFDAVARVKPDATLYAHELELGHDINQYRWTYDHACRKIQHQPHDGTLVLTWGEKREMP